jgi:hypothetical protein
MEIDPFADLTFDIKIQLVQLELLPVSIPQKLGKMRAPQL